MRGENRDVFFFPLLVPDWFCLRNHKSRKRPNRINRYFSSFDVAHYIKRVYVYRHSSILYVYVMNYTTGNRFSFRVHENCVIVGYVYCNNDKACARACERWWLLSEWKEKSSIWTRTVSCGYETYARFRSTYCGDGGHTCERRNSQRLSRSVWRVYVFWTIYPVTNRGYVIFSSPLFRSYGGKPPVDEIHTYADKNRIRNGKKPPRRTTSGRNANGVTSGVATLRHELGTNQKGGSTGDALSNIRLSDGKSRNRD